MLQYFLFFTGIMSHTHTHTHTGFGPIHNWQGPLFWKNSSWICPWCPKRFAKTFVNFSQFRPWCPKHSQVSMHVRKNRPFTKYNPPVCKSWPRASIGPRIQMPCTTENISKGTCTQNEDHGNVCT